MKLAYLLTSLLVLGPAGNDSSLRLTLPLANQRRRARAKRAILNHFPRKTAHPSSLNAAQTGKTSQTKSESVFFSITYNVLPRAMLPIVFATLLPGTLC